MILFEKFGHTMMSHGRIYFYGYGYGVKCYRFSQTHVNAPMQIRIDNADQLTVEALWGRVPEL